MTNDFKIGISVVVLDGILDPDDNKTHIGGWCGRITKIENDNLIEIAWDSSTLKNMPISQITKYDEEGLDWTSMRLECDDIEVCESRDNPDDVDKAIFSINKKIEPSFWKLLKRKFKSLTS